MCPDKAGGAGSAESDLPAEIHIVLKEFISSGSLQDLRLLNRGHINDTYISSWERNGGRENFIHQRINNRVFSDIPRLMENFRQVTDHIRRKIELAGEPCECTLELLRTVDDKIWLRTENGRYWRTLRYIDGTVSYDRCTDENLAFETARAFGRFQRHLLDLNTSHIYEVLPFFHHTPTRYEQLKEAIKLDPLGRSKLAAEEITFAMDREDIGGCIAVLVEGGHLGKRVIHYDTKLNNILFSASTGKAVCVIDLDTCMPGCVLYDFGDLVRSVGSAAAEDEHDLSAIELDSCLFRALTEGYLASVADYWSDLEIELMHFAPRLIALTLGIRFLADFLLGDGYFKIRYPDHNLRRTRAQFKIARSMEEQEKSMREIVAKASGRL